MVGHHADYKSLPFNAFRVGLLLLLGCFAEQFVLAQSVARKQLTLRDTGNFGEISTRSVKRFCEATRKDKAFLETVREIRVDVAAFVQKRFRLSKEQIENMAIKFDQPETTDLFALTCIRALKLKQDITIRFTAARSREKAKFQRKMEKMQTLS